MPPQFVYFDLDDTLLDHRSAEQAALADLHATLPALGVHSLDEVCATYHRHNSALWKSYAEGDLDRDTLQRLRFERLLAAFQLDGLDPLDVGHAYLDRYADHWTWVDGAEDAFLAVAERFRVGILTNGFAAVQHAKLDRFPRLREQAEQIVISEEIGYLKPHPTIFAHATQSAGVEAEAILYIGDSLHSDVAGATQAGWQMAWFTPENGTPKYGRSGGSPQHQRPPEGVFRFSDWPDLLRRLDIASGS